MELTNKQAAGALRAMAVSRELYYADHADELDECSVQALKFMRSALLKGAEALEAEGGAEE